MIYCWISLADATSYWGNIWSAIQVLHNRVLLIAWLGYIFCLTGGLHCILLGLLLFLVHHLLENIFFLFWGGEKGNYLFQDKMVVTQFGD